MRRCYLAERDTSLTPLYGDDTAVLCSFKFSAVVPRISYVHCMSDVCEKTKKKADLLKWSCFRQEAH